jgi:hypothetical protein
MSGSALVTIIIIFAFMLMWILGTLLMRITFNRTLKDLLIMLREAQAFSPETAKYIDEVGIKGKTLLNFRMMRDYTPQVLEVLIKENIVQVTEEGKIYLSEQTLAGHKLGSIAK